MTQLIQPSDPQYFTQTSDGSYDRHNYTVVFKNKKTLQFDDYEQMRAYWFQCGRNWKNCKVNVLDKKQIKKKSNGGFK